MLRYQPYDVNVTVVAGEAGLLLVDTRADRVEGKDLLEDVRRLSATPVVAVVNTHWHFDHVGGNLAVLAEFPDVEVTCHVEAARELSEAQAGPMAEQLADVAAPTSTFSSVRVIDLGDRLVEVVHPGRGHTAGDAVLRIPDADVVLAGDLVEESGPPAYGDDCFPLEWPGSLDMVLQLIGPATTVVPGHGAAVTRDFVRDQRGDIGMVAATIEHLAGQGVSAADALRAAEWPFADEVLAEAISRGYRQLPAMGRRLPLA